MLSARMSGPWTLSALAAEVHLSRSQLVQALGAVTGHAPMAYLRQMRVERMARLLAATDLSVAEAARGGLDRAELREPVLPRPPRHVTHRVPPPAHHANHVSPDHLRAASVRAGPSLAGNGRCGCVSAGW
jgi:hypothetical protein